MKKKFLLSLRPSLFMALTLFFAISFHGCSENEEFPEAETEELTYDADEINDLFLPLTRASEAPYPESPTPTSTTISYWDGTTVTKPAKFNEKERTITIEKAEELAWISYESMAGNSFENYTITLNVHIDLGGFKWQPIGGSYRTQFQGLFNGAKFSISNLNVSGETPLGLFGYCKGKTAAIINTVIESGSVYSNSGSFAGGICAILNDYACIAHCTNGATIAGNYCVGGIVGKATYGNIYNCHNINDVGRCNKPTLQVYELGGICGHAVGTTIEKCTNKANISTTNGCFLAGICGIAEPKISGNKKVYSSIYDCHNSGNIVGSTSTAGICGIITYGTVAFCTNSGAINGTGGIVGNMRYESLILRCDNLETGTVTSTGNAGGVAAQIYGSIMKGCSNLAEVSGKGIVGGVVGSNSFSSMIASCNRGNVRGTGNAGGVSGSSNFGKMIACYNRGEVKANEYVAGISALVGDKLKMHACYNSGQVTSHPSLLVYSGGVFSRATLFSKYSGVYWTGANKPIGSIIFCDKKIVDGITQFSPSDWPSAGIGEGKDPEWGLGDGEGSGKYWRSLGSYSANSYPILYFEQLPPI